MGLFDKAFDRLEEADFWAMVGNAVETDQLEFKSDAYGTLTESTKFELRKDMCALANNKGGFLICGIECSQGQAVTNILGLGNNVNYEDLITQLTQVYTAQGLVEPPLIGVQIRAIDAPTANNGKIIAIRVPQGASSPHWVKKPGDKYGRFYLRRSNLSDEMNYGELRDRFLLSESRIERIRDFRFERLEYIGDRSNPNIPIALNDQLRLVVQCIPLSFGTVGSEVDFRKNPLSLVGALEPAEPLSYNLNGAYQVTVYARTGNPPNGYRHVFRSGGVEVVTLVPTNETNGNPITKFDLNQIELTLLKMLANAHNLFQQFSIPLPYLASISILGFPLGADLGYTHYDQIRGQTFKGKRVSHSNIIPPEFLITQTSFDPKPLLKTSFDLIWNAAGIVGSRSYDDQGNWVETRYS